MPRLVQRWTHAHVAANVGGRPGSRKPVAHGGRLARASQGLAGSLHGELPGGLVRSLAAGGIFEAGDGEEAIRVADMRDPDVVIMDMALPHMHGVDAIAAIMATRPGTRVLVLSSSDDDDQVVAAVRAGATGYLVKNAGA